MGLGQVLLIGDAPPNTPDEVLRKRDDHGGAAYWAAAPFAAAVSAAAEAEALRARGVPVHAFYVRRGEDVQREFEGLSRATGGGAGFLDIDSAEGARLLTDTVAQARAPPIPTLPSPLLAIRRLRRARCPSAAAVCVRVRSRARAARRLHCARYPSAAVCVCARAHVGAQSGVRGRARVAVARRKPAGAVTRRAGAQEILRRVGGEPLGDAYVRQYQDLYGGCTYTR